MVDFRITYTLPIQSQPPKSLGETPYQKHPPLSPLIRGVGTLRRNWVIDKCQLISIIHHSFRF